MNIMQDQDWDRIEVHKFVWNKFEPPQAGPKGGVQGGTE